MRIISDTRVISLEELHVFSWGIKHVRQSNIYTVRRSQPFSASPDSIEIFRSRDDINVLCEESQSDDARCPELLPALMLDGVRRHMVAIQDQGDPNSLWNVPSQPRQ